MINFEAPIKPHYTASIEVRDAKFHLRNTYGNDGETLIEVYDENEKFIAEVDLGFGIDLQDEPAEVELHAIKVYEFIDESVVF
jgi:hypothetical protein